MFFFSGEKEPKDAVRVKVTLFSKGLLTRNDICHLSMQPTLFDLFVKYLDIEFSLFYRFSLEKIKKM